MERIHPCRCDKCLTCRDEELRRAREHAAQLAENAMTRFLFTGVEREAYLEGCRMAAKAIREFAQ